MLADSEDILIAGEAGDGKQAIEEARRLRPRVILMDLMLPGIDGAAATRAILAELPETAILALASTDTEDTVMAAVEAGALGFLDKTAQPEDYAQAIRRVAQGETWFSEHLTRRLMCRPVPPAAQPLTLREREVLTMLARGWSNRRISQELSIAEITVRTHVSHVLGKLGVHNRVEAALHALRSGW